MASWNVMRGRRLRELDRKSPASGVLPQMDFRLDPAQLSGIEAAMRAFPAAVRQAALLAADRARRSVRAELVRRYRRLVTLTPAYIGRGVTSKKARLTAAGAEAEIRIATKNLPLVRYRVTPERPPQLRGVSVRGRRRTSYRLRLSGRTYGDAPHGAGAAGKLFVAAMKSGHIGVFYRTSGGKIREEYAPSLQYHAHADGFMPAITSLAAARFERDFLDEARRITGMPA